MIKIFFVPAMSLVLSGCATKITPQTLQPQTDINNKPLLVTGSMNDNDMGTLYQRCAIKKEGKEIDKGWVSTTLKLFPPNEQGMNAVNTEQIEKGGNYNSVEINDISADGSIGILGRGEGEYSRGYKYNASTDQTLTFNSNSLKYSTATKAYMEKKPDCEFAYIKALQRGSSHSEDLTKVTVKAGGGNEAAFTANGQYYQAGTTITSKTGIVLYELAMVNTEMLEGMQLPDGKAVRPLNERQMQIYRAKIRLPAGVNGI